MLLRRDTIRHIETKADMSNRLDKDATEHSIAL